MRCGQLKGFGSHLHTVLLVLLGRLGFQFWEGGGVHRAPQMGGGGVRGKGSIDRTILSHYELWHRRWRAWQMMNFLNPLDALISKVPFSFSAEFWARVTSGSGGLSRPPPPPGG